MPKRFKFYIDDNLHFACNVNSEKHNGQRCKNHTVIGTNICFSHLLYDKNLRIKQSNTVIGQKFALNSHKDNNEIIFKPNETIIFYGGDIINKRELDRRYDNYTAPYGVRIRDVNGDEMFRDAACNRGIGSLANHGTGNRENARFSFARDGTLNLKATKNIKNDNEIFINYNKGSARNDPTRFLMNERRIDYNTVNVNKILPYYYD